MNENNAMCLLDFKDKGRVPQTMVNILVRNSLQLVVVENYHVKVRSRSKLKDVRKTDEAVYIPLLESLLQLLSDESIWEELYLDEIFFFIV